jgi:hypothetical protein
MFKTKKIRIDSNLADKEFTSSEISEVTGVSLRQLQWWDEQKVVSPRHEGHKRVYLAEEAIEIAVIAELRRKEDGRQKLQMRQGLTGTILAVNQAWNFVVLSLGDRQGVVPNAEMLVQRDGQYLGKIRVTSVEPSTSIADILVRTVPRGLSVMPGDRVIYQALRD